MCLDLPPGTITEITGRNGAGKSTLLRLLAGVTPPDPGDDLRPSTDREVPGVTDWRQTVERSLMAYLPW